MNEKIRSLCLDSLQLALRLARSEITIHEYVRQQMVILRQLEIELGGEPRQN